MVKYDAEKLKQLAADLEEVERRKTFRRLDFYKPYPKQLEFHELGATKRERLFMAGNQNGKTYCGAAEVAMHLTGEYPSWWKGRVFDKPVNFWVAGKTGVMVRNDPQRLLFGKPGVLELKGTGLVPKENIIDISLGRGVTDGFDTVQVRHKTGGVSTVGFKSYDSGARNFQGSTLDGIWLDEEPDEDVYQECLTRTVATDGFVFLTFTPLLGRSKVVLRYLNETSPDRAVARMTIDEAEHLTPEMRRKSLEGFSEHERKARAYGIPLLGSGAIFELPQEKVTEPTIEHVPLHWFKIWGIDFGIGHPFAAALIAWDKDLDVIHVLHAFKMPDTLPIDHAAAMKPVGIDVPVAWPQDGMAREKSGTEVHLLYKKEGLKMHHEHATFAEGGYSTEAGVMEMQQRERGGKLKYAAHLSALFEERNWYHRKDGLIVKENDDIMSALRVAIMMKRFAKQVMLGGKKAQRQNGGRAKGIDFDYF